MTSLRKRHPSVSGLNGGDVPVSEPSTEKERVLAFSDDEEDVSPLPIQNGSTSSVTGKTDPVIQPDFTSDIISESTVPSQFSAEAEEVDGDLDIFNKAVHITNLNEVDHAELLRKMHERFKRKVKKWEALAHTYARYNFAMNFTILVLQLLQMILHQFSNIWTVADKEIMESRRQSKSLLHSIGIYKMSEWRNASGNGDYEGRGFVLGIFHAVFSPFVLQTIHGLLTAFTAVLAGLQLKLKLSQKSERYRRGAKVYGRLLRISTYYIMLVESGGKIDDVTGLWRDAMKKEGKWIPLVRTYMPV